ALSRCRNGLENKQRGHGRECSVPGLLGVCSQTPRLLAVLVRTPLLGLFSSVVQPFARLCVPWWPRLCARYWLPFQKRSSRGRPCSWIVSRSRGLVVPSSGGRASGEALRVGLRRRG